MSTKVFTQPTHADLTTAPMSPLDPIRTSTVGLQLSDGLRIQGSELLHCLRDSRTAACFRAAAVLLVDGSVIGRTSRIYLASASKKLSA
jgi:hypothetical protein